MNLNIQEKPFIEQEIGCDVDVHGYRILLKAIDLPEKTQAGIYLPDRRQEKRSYNIGRVLKMGPNAYMPLEKFGGKPYCAVGDWVIYSSYERDEIKINDHLCFFINDERIYATIGDIANIIGKSNVLDGLHQNENKNNSTVN